MSALATEHPSWSIESRLCSSSEAAVGNDGRFFLEMDLSPEPHALRRRAADVQFMAVAEAGMLEQQAILLCESIRAFAGAYAASAIVVVTPRSGRRPSSTTRRRLDKLSVDYLELEIDTPRPEYGPSFRVHAAAHVERLPGPATLVQLDSDTLFLGEPDFALCDVDVATRPVDLKGICTTGADDPADAYWRHLCALAEVEYDAVPWLTTTIDHRAVRASYNGGLIVARRERGIFARTEDLFLRVVRSPLHSYAEPPQPILIGSGHVSPAGFAYWGTSQAAISLACVAADATVGILPPEYNVPLHYFDACDAAAKALPVHVHYHWLGLQQYAAINPLLDGRLGLSPRQANWLRQRMPLDTERPRRPSWLRNWRSHATPVVPEGG